MTKKILAMDVSIIMTSLSYSPKVASIQIERAFRDMYYNYLILYCLLLLQCCSDRSMDYLKGAQVRLPHYTEDHAARSVPRT